MHPLFRANCELLQQGRALLLRYDDFRFVATDAASYGAGIGSHFRHVLDHYRSFLRGLPRGAINYDDRERGTSAEASVAASLQALDDVEADLAACRGDPAAALLVRVSASVEGESEYSQSSLGRELQFLVSHTVHHYALIAIASRLQGIFPDASFGVAPSTLKYMGAAAH